MRTLYVFTFLLILFLSMKRLNMDIVFDKAFIIEQIRNHNLSVDDFIGTLKSGAYVYQFDESYAILSPKTIECGGKGYIIKGKEEFEIMYKEDSFPQIFNGREDIFELNRSILKNCDVYARSLHLKYRDFFLEDVKAIDQLCDSICRAIAINSKHVDQRELLEKIMLLIEVFRSRNEYSWSIRKVYGEYTYFYIPILKNNDKELGIDTIVASMFEGESWETIVKGSKFSLSNVSWIK